MVHKRDQTNAVAIAVELEARQAVRRADLASQVDEMIGTKPPRIDAVVHGGGKLTHVGRGHFAFLDEADAQRVEHGGNPGSRDLRIMREHRGDGVPAHPGARRVVTLEVVGMKLDKTRNDVVALHILAGVGTASGNVGYLSVADRDRALDDLVGKHDARIVEYRQGGHLRRSFWRACAQSGGTN